MTSTRSSTWIRAQPTFVKSEYEGLTKNSHPLKLFQYISITKLIYEFLFGNRVRKQENDEGLGAAQLTKQVKAHKSTQKHVKVCTSIQKHVKACKQDQKDLQFCPLLVALLVWRSSVLAICSMPMCNAYVQCLCAMPMCNAYVQCLCAMHMCNAYLQCLCAMPICNAYGKAWQSMSTLHNAGQN